jgi:hypothetical protein
MPIIFLEGPESAFSSGILDRQVIDHQENAADHRPPSNDHLSGDRQSNGDDRSIANRQRGLPKPNSSSVEMVMGLIGKFKSSKDNCVEALLVAPQLPSAAPGSVAEKDDWASVCRTLGHWLTFGLV